MKRFINSLLDLFNLGAFARNTFNYLKYITDPALIRRNRAFARRAAPDGLPVPTPRLAYLVCGQYDLEALFHNGRKGADWIEAIMLKNGLCFSEIRSILDFGCGCGRVLRFWEKYSSEVKICGSDYNSLLVEWCRENLPFAEVSVNEVNPPTFYSDDSFGLVYAISVFTHLSEEMQIPWLNELIRITRPGGYIIITVHGASRISVLPEDLQDKFNRGELVVRGEKYFGSNICGVYHPREYLVQHSSGRLREIDYIERGATDADQDILLLQLIDKN